MLTITLLLLEYLVRSLSSNNTHIVKTINWIFHMPDFLRLVCQITKIWYNFFGVFLDWYIFTSTTSIYNARCTNVLRLAVYVVVCVAAYAIYALVYDVVYKYLYVIYVIYTVVCDVVYVFCAVSIHCGVCVVVCDVFYDVVCIYFKELHFFSLKKLTNILTGSGMLPINKSNHSFQIFFVNGLFFTILLILSSSMLMDVEMDLRFLGFISLKEPFFWFITVYGISFNINLKNLYRF